MALALALAAGHHGSPRASPVWPSALASSSTALAPKPAGVVSLAFAVHDPDSTTTTSSFV